MYIMNRYFCNKMNTHLHIIFSKFFFLHRLNRAAEPHIKFQPIFMCSVKTSLFVPHQSYCHFLIFFQHDWYMSQTIAVDQLSP